MKTVVTAKGESLLSYYSHAFGVIKQNLASFMYALLFILIFCTLLIGPQLHDGALGSLLSIISLPALPILVILFVLAPVFLVFMTKAYALEQPWSIDQGIRQTLQIAIIWRYLWTLLSMAIIFLGLFVLLMVGVTVLLKILGGSGWQVFLAWVFMFSIVVPLIFFALQVLWLLAVPIAVLKDKSGKSALKYSTHLVKQHFWRTIGVLAIFLIIMGITSILVKAIGSLTMSIFFAEALTSPATDPEIITDGALPTQTTSPTELSVAPMFAFFILSMVVGLFCSAFALILNTLLFLNYEYLDPSNTSSPASPPTP